MDHVLELSTRVSGEQRAVEVAASLKFLQPVSRQMVHRAAVAEVFVTDAFPMGDDRYLVAAQWPRDHALYHPDASGLTDPLLLTETVRQALVYLAHEYYEIPLDYRFIGCDTDFEITDPEALLVGDAPLHVVLDARWSWVDNKPPRRFGMRLEVVVTVAGRECGRGSLRVFAVDERRYGLLRWRGAGDRADDGGQGNKGAVVTRMPTTAVGRLRAKDCVLGRTDTGEWRLLFDLKHAVLFDHPGDHIPLMVTLEGFRQLGHHLVGHRPGVPQGSVLSTLRMDCLAFAELDEPVLLDVEEQNSPSDRPGTTRLRVTALQRNSVIATAAMVWAPPSHLDAPDDTRSLAGAGRA